MQQGLRKLIHDYQAAVARAVAELKSGGIDVPDSNRGWSLNGMPQRGVLPSGATYAKHGYGCHVSLADGEVDFDFGDSGEIDGFDGWRLWRYAEPRSDIYGPTSYAALDDQLKLLHSQGILRKDPQGSLYYFRHDA
jgi:hypothetical protein